MLKIQNLKSHVNNKQILNGINFEIKSGEVVSIMGPNGSGKSSLASVIAGNPKFKINGLILFENKKINNLKSFERSLLGIFLAHQSPSAISGIDLSSYLFEIHKSAASFKKLKPKSIFDFNLELESYIKKLKIKKEFLNQSLNIGLSGGEKKKIEMLQMLVLDPKLIILDEIDSGLDVDSLKLVAQIIKEFKDESKAIIIITHLRKILDYIKPDKVLVMKDGNIFKEGGVNLITELEKRGFN